MLISTHGRYALRMLITLSAREKEAGGEGIPLRQLSEDTHISMKYLESIISSLLKAGIVAAKRGKNGGYRLAREEKEIRVSEILEAAGEDTAPVTCLKSEVPCPMSDSCPTLPLYKKLDSLIYGFLDNITLEDLITGNY